ncbi:MAG: hypothetical protein ABJB74_19475 [Gemmatimonas sp.]
MRTEPARTEPATVATQDATQTLLTRFAVALNRRQSYRPSHPMVVRAEGQLLETIMQVMASRETLTLGVSPRELRWDGQRMRSRQSVTREVAARLYRRGVSSLVFQPGVTHESVNLLLGWLTPQPGRSAASSDGFAGAPELPGFVIGRIPYDRLVLTDSAEASEEQITALWFALGSVALGQKSTENIASDAFGPHSVPAETIAAAIRNGVHDEDYARRVAGMFFTLVDQATHATPDQRAAIGKRLHAILPLLDTGTVATILAHVGNEEQQRAFMAQVTDALPLNAVVDWLETAAHSSDRSISHQLLRLLRKLSTLADGNVAGSVIDANFRDAAQELVTGWDLDETNPGEHIELLDQIALIETDRVTNTNVTSPAALLAEQEGEPARLVQMALEMGEAGDDAIAAVHRLTIEGRTAHMLEWIANADDSRASVALKTAAASPSALRIVLLKELPDTNAARVLLPAATEEGIAALLDVLASSTVRVIRRLVIDRLREFGPAVWKQLLERLDNTTWFFARNLLVLMRDIRNNIRDTGGDISALPIVGVARYLSHEREQLRLEAVRLLLEDPTMRDGALRRAFDDPHPRVVREAVEWMIAMGSIVGATHASGVPAEFLTRVIALIENRQQPDEIRARAVWALEAHRGPQALHWLLGHVSKKRLLSRRPGIAESSPTVLAALGLLAKRYANEPRALLMLSMARATKDLRSHAAAPATTQKQ